MSAPTITRRELNRATLARQMLLERERVAVPDAVERLAGLQAQEPRPPFVGLWTRLEGFDPDDLRQALRGREVVRATWLRATLHLVGAADYLALRAALQPAMTGALKGLKSRSEGLDVEQVVARARRLLRAGPQTFDDLRAALQDAFPDVDHRVMGYAVRTHVPLVMEPTEDRWGFPRSARFIVADAWLGTPVGSDAAPDALVRRYLAAFGPASVADAQAWSGVKGLKPVFERLRPALVTFRDERGRELFDLPDAPRPGADVPAPARFLPDFDNLVLAHDDRTRVIADEHRGAVTTKNLRVRATFLHDGVVRGTWSTEVRRRAATLRLAPFARLTKQARAELTAEGEVLLRLLEPDATSHDVALAAQAGRERVRRASRPRSP